MNYGNDSGAFSGEKERSRPPAICQTANGAAVGLIHGKLVDDIVGNVIAGAQILIRP